MKTLEQLFEEINESEELQKCVAETIKNNGDWGDFLKKNGCEASVAEAKSFLEEKADALKGSGELTPEQLEQAAGGTGGVALTVLLGVCVAGTAAYGAAVINDIAKNSGC